MKKTYITPEALTVVLGSKMQMMTGSTPSDVTVNPGGGSVGAGSVETKGVSNVNVWDEEW